MHKTSLDNFSIGKRKTAISRINLIEGKGEITINNRQALEYFQYNPNLIHKIKLPLIILNLTNQFDIMIKTSGGGLVAQAESIGLAISKVLCKKDISNRSLLKINGLLTRNSKIKERKKYGLKKARKSPQYSKR